MDCFGLPIDLSCLLFSHFYVDHTCSMLLAPICCYGALVNAELVQADMQRCPCKKGVKVSEIKALKSVLIYNSQFYFTWFPFLTGVI